MDLVAQMQEMEKDSNKAMEALKKEHAEQLEELQQRLEEAEAAAAKGRGRKGARWVWVRVQGELAVLLQHFIHCASGVLVANHNHSKRACWGTLNWFSPRSVIIS